MYELIRLSFYRDVPVKTTFLHILLNILKSGEYSSSIHDLAEESGISVNDARRSVRVLVSSGYIATSNDGFKKTKFSIKDEFINLLQADGKPMVSRLQADGKPMVSASNCNTESYGNLLQADGKPMVSRLQADGKPMVSQTQSETKMKRFIPPSKQDVSMYIDEKGYHFEAEEFIAHYTANGWVQGKGKKIKDWKSCCVTWEKSWKERNKEQIPDETILNENRQLLSQYSPLEGYGKFIHYIGNHCQNIMRFVPLPSIEQVGIIFRDYQAYTVEALGMMDGDRYLAGSTFYSKFIQAINNIKKAKGDAITRTIDNEAARDRRDQSLAANDEERESRIDTATFFGNY